MKMYAIYDEKAEAYSPVLMFKADGEAVRDFVAASRNPQSNISQYPADFTLFRVGAFDLTTGVLTVATPKVSLGNALELRALVPQSELRRDFEGHSTVKNISLQDAAAADNAAVSGSA